MRKQIKRRKSAPYDKAVVRRIRRDPGFAGEYVKAVLEDTDEPRVILVALRHLAQAYGMDEIAGVAGVRRESLYRTLSPKGNPFLSTFYAFAKAVGLKFTLELATQPRSKGGITVRRTI
jgi:probable addiction module antidote protein